MGKLVLLLLALPVVELVVLVRLADAIGGWRVFLLVLASGLIGAQLARMAGWQVIAQSQKAIATGKIPTDVLNGALLFLASVFLMIPGLVSDALAIVLIIPWSRRAIGRRVVAGIERAVEEGKLRVVAAQARQTEAWRGAARPDPNMVIDTDGETVESTVTTSEDVKPPRLGS